MIDKADGCRQEAAWSMSAFGSLWDLVESKQLATRRSLNAGGGAPC